MNNHPHPHQLEQYFARTLAPYLFLAVHRHVSSCRLCSEKYPPQATIKEDYEMLWSAVTAKIEGEPYHLSDAAAYLYLDKHLDEIDHEIADSHLELCGACRAKVRRLRDSIEDPQFKKSVASLHDETSREVGFRQRLGRAIGLTARWRPLPTAALIILASIITVALILLRNQTARLSVPSASNGAVTPDNGNLRATDSQASEKQEVTEARTNETSVEGGKQSAQDNQQPVPESKPLNVVTINDGFRLVTIDERGQLRGLEELPSELRQAVRAALISQTLERPTTLSELRAQASTLRGTTRKGVPFKLLGPVGEVIQSDQPEFSWQPLTGAQSYTVTITDPQLNEVAVSAPLTATRWRIPRPLARGAVYSWQVTALRDGQSITSPLLPAPEARFKVLDRARDQELLRARRAYNGAHLTLGVLYTRDGLLDEAEQEFRALLRENPQSDVARKLLRNVELMKRE